MSHHPNLPAIIPGVSAREERSFAAKENSASGINGAYQAQLLGQAGARRGLRAGRPAIDQALSAYQDAEWSGSADRRQLLGYLIGERA